MAPVAGDRCPRRMPRSWCRAGSLIDTIVRFVELGTKIGRVLWERNGLGLQNAIKRCLPCLILIQEFVESVANNSGDGHAPPLRFTEYRSVTPVIKQDVQPVLHHAQRLAHVPVPVHDGVNRHERSPASSL